MKTPGRSLRVFMLLPGLLLLAFLALVFWPQSPPSAEAIANRGKGVPASKSFSLLEPATWKTSTGGGWEWIELGIDAVSAWDKNPWKIERPRFCEHFQLLKASKNPNDQAEYQRLLELGHKWHENLLARYPELKVVYRNLPDERNGLKQCLEFQKRFLAETGSMDFKFPDNIRESLTNSLKPWDASAAQAWLDGHRDLMNELRRISQISESSTQGLGAESGGGFFRDCGTALLIEARLAAEGGKVQEALDAVKAANAFSCLLRDSDAPFLIHEMIGAAIQEQIRNCVLQTILPTLPKDQLDLNAWQAAVQPIPQSPAAFSNILKAEWNGMMQFYILPALADPAETGTPADAELFVEAYTQYTLKLVTQNQNLALNQLHAIPWEPFDSRQFSSRGRQLGESFGSVDCRTLWERCQIKTGLTQAAFAIIKEQSPPNDFIFGQPYHWNPETRELSLPDGLESKDYHLKPIKLPKL